MQDIGVKVLGMLGGAAQGSFQRLDRSDVEFEAYYVPLRDMIRRHNLDGLDLDVEEPMSLNGIVRLIDRLRTDFGAEFLITLAPVATALRTCISELFSPSRLAVELSELFLEQGESSTHETSYNFSHYLERVMLTSSFA